MPQFGTKQELLTFLARAAIRAHLDSLTPAELVQRVERSRVRAQAETLAAQVDRDARNAALRGPAVSTSTDSATAIRAASAYVYKLATECAAVYTGGFMHTRMRAAIADLAATAGIATLKGIPYTFAPTATTDARAQCAIACHAFARNPSVVTWLQADRALAQLSYSSDSVADEITPVHSLAPDVDGFAPDAFVCKRAHPDDVNAIHAGSAGVARTKPGDCPHSYESASVRIDKRQRYAKRALRELLATSENARVIVRLIGTFSPQETELAMSASS